LSEATRKFDPAAALDEHLRAVAYRNGGGATLFLAAFTAVLWPSDLLVFQGMDDVQEATAWARVVIIGVLLAAYATMRSRLGPRHPTLILATGGALIMLGIGWCLGKLGGADKPWIHLSYAAMFMTVLAPTPLRPRILLVFAMTTALIAGFLVPHPEHLDDPLLRMMLSFVISVSVLAVAVGHLSFRILRQSFYQQLALDELNETLESRVRAQTADLRRLTDHLERAREEERTRIARELHDELGQELTALHLSLDLTRQRFQRDAQCIGGNLSELETLLQRTRKTTRAIVTELRPRMLDEMGLPAALEWLARQTEERSGVRCALNAQGLEGLPLDTSTVAFRIVQEALTNVARHAHAHRAEVTVSAAKGWLALTVSDDGVGMPENLTPSGFGLIGIRERVTTLAGKLELASRPGGGTKLTVRLPLPAARMEVAS
jgi:signal transduction histidine kinase